MSHFSGLVNHGTQIGWPPQACLAGKLTDLLSEDVVMKVKKPLVEVAVK